MKRYINLLPGTDQQTIKTKRISNQIWKCGVAVSCSLVALWILLYGTGLYLNIEHRATKVRLATEMRALGELESTSAKQEIEKFNSDLINFGKLQQVRHTWAEVALEIARIIPTNMRLDSMSIVGRDGFVEISGNGGDRAAILGFRENLIASPFFENVNFPLANLERATNAPWSYRFSLEGTQK